MSIDDIEHLKQNALFGIVKIQLLRLTGGDCVFLSRNTSSEQSYRECYETDIQILKSASCQRRDLDVYGFFI